MLTKTFSPKELAEIVGVSESSIKRWGDSGLIDVIRTAGGHRRIGMHSALRFIRAQGLRIVRPDLLGLPDLDEVPTAAQAGALSPDLLFETLREGDVRRARGMIVAGYLGGTAPAALFDGPVAGALRRLGALWLTDERGIYEEHVATIACLEAVNQIRLLVPPPVGEAPVALGGAPEHDHYLLPTLMAATVLADAGYHTVNLGPNTPTSAFLHAIEDHTPAMIWLAMKLPFAEDAREILIEELLLPLEDQPVEVVLGGDAAGVEGWPPAVHYIETMRDLDVFARARLA